MRSFDDYLMNLARFNYATRKLSNASALYARGMSGFCYVETYYWLVSAKICRFCDTVCDTMISKTNFSKQTCAYTTKMSTLSKINDCQSYV